MMSHVKPAISTEQDALETNKEQETMISQKADTLLAQILSPLPRFESFKEQLERCDRFREFCDKNQDNLPLKHLEAEASKVPYEDNLVNRLKDKQEEILQFVKEKINSEKDKILSGEQGCRYPYQIRGFENEFDLVLQQGSDPNETVYYSRGDFTFPYRKLCREKDPQLTHREAADIIDKILRKLEQLRDDMGNLLVINSRSGTHELPALDGALAHIIRSEQSGNEDFFKDREKARGRKFRGIHDFQQLKKNLSAIAFLEKTGRNKVKRCPLMPGWETVRPTPIPDSVLEYFKKFRKRI